MNTKINRYSFIIVSGVMIFFLGIVFIPFNTSQKKNSKKEKALKAFGFISEDRKWLENFFNEVFLKEMGIYTLWGSKPITCFDVGYPTTQMIREMETYYDQLSEEDKKDWLVCEYNLDELWPKWEQALAKLPISKYIFIKHSKQEEGIGQVDHIYFLNKELVVQTLQQEYSIFKNHLGKDFDPEELVSNVVDPNSSFWKFFRYPPTMGILLGFGKENAYLFTWKFFEGATPSVKEYVSSFNMKTSDDLTEHIKTLSINDHPIPVFRSFYRDKDPVVERYQRERLGIIKRYKGKDFVSLTLKQLCRK